MRRFINEGKVKLKNVADDARVELGGLKDRAAGAIPDDWKPGEGSKGAEEKIRALEVMPENVKLLYCRVLVLQAALDGDVDPREIANLYVFASRIDLAPESRESFRREISALDASALVSDTEMPTSDEQRTLECVLSLRSSVRDDERDVLTSALIKYMLWISGTDGEVAVAERARIEGVAERFFPGKAKDVIAQNEEMISTEEAYVKGEISAGQFEKSMKRTASQAVALGLPTAAIYFSGSVVGLSAAGFTSGLAALGLGGALGLSAMLTGVGTIIVLGVVTYTAVRYALGTNERGQKKKREHMIQEILKRHQKAMADLSEDIANLAIRMEEYLTRSESNESRLSALKDEIKTFKLALSTLKSREEVLEREEQSLAT